MLLYILFGGSLRFPSVTFSSSSVTRSYSQVFWFSIRFLIFKNSLELTAPVFSVFFVYGIGQFLP